MDRLFSVLPKVLRKRGLTEQAEGALVVHRAQRWMSERLPVLESYIRVQKVKDGVLYVNCQHSVAMQECQAVIGDLRVYLQTECPFSRIQEIRVIRT